MAPSNLNHEKRVFITKFNYKRILKVLDYSKVPELEGEIYEVPIKFFSKYEQASLLLVRMLNEEPEKLLQLNLIKWRDNTGNMVWENEQPCFHFNANCPTMFSDYLNYEIPESICNKGEEEKKKFRSWFKSYVDLLTNDNLEEYLNKQDFQFNTREIPKKIERPNSGKHDFQILHLERIKEQIEKILLDAEGYWLSSAKKNLILNKYSKLTFLALKKGPVTLQNDTQYSQDEIIEVLREFENLYKKPLKNILAFSYYIAKFNSDFSFSQQFLHTIGFRGHTCPTRQ